MSVPFRKRLQSYIPKSVRDLFRSLEFRQSTERELKNLTLKENDFASDSFDLPPSQHSTKEYIATEINSAVTGLLDYKGGYDAATNTPNLDSSPPAGTIFKGDFYTVDNGGTFYTRQVDPGDGLIAEVDDPSQESDWTVVVGSSGSIYTIDGALSGARTITMDGNQLNLNQSTTGNYIKMDAPNANASPTFIDGRRDGATRAKFGLNSGSGRLELFHFGSTKYVDLNPGGLINYFLTDTAIGNTTASARLHIKGASGADSLLVENSSGDDVLNIKDDGQIKLGTTTGSNNLLNQEPLQINSAGGSITNYIRKSGGTWRILNFTGGEPYMTVSGTAAANVTFGTGQVLINSTSGVHYKYGAAASAPAFSGLSVSDNSASSAYPAKAFQNARIDSTRITDKITNNGVGAASGGLQVFNTTTKKLQYWDESAWVELGVSDTIYTADGSINEDRVVTVSEDPTTKTTYTTTFESNKITNTTTRNAAGNQLIIKETTNNSPTGYSQTRGSVLKLEHVGSTDTVTDYINSISINSGSSDYTQRSQMGFRTNRAFVFKATDTSWPLYFAVQGGPSNNLKTLVYSGQQDGGLFQLKASNAKTTKITLADTSSAPGTNGYYRYISGDNNGDLILGRKLSGGSEEAYITCSGVGGYGADIAVGVNQGTPAATLHVTGSGASNLTTSLIVENSDGDEILNVRDDQYVTITGSNTIDNFFILKNDATWTMLDAGDAGSNAGQLRIKSNNNNRFWFKANDGLAIADAGAVTMDSSAVLKVDSSSKGFLPPRNSDPASNISNPTTGLIAYDTTDNELQFYNGSAWTSAGGGGAWTVSGNDIYYNTGAVSVGTTTPNASAAVQVDSTTQGFLPPRMTTAQRTAISSPAEGLMVFDTDLKQWMGYDSTQWVVIG